jgi:hypothetical protein
MYNSKDVLEAARVIRLYLPDLVGAEAEIVDRTLAKLLAKAESGEAIENQILALLAEHDATREWTQQFLIDKVPPPVMRSYHPVAYDPLAGSVSRIDAKTFICSIADCQITWYQPKAGINPPPCPEHKIPLVLVEPNPA